MSPLLKANKTTSSMSRTSTDGEGNLREDDEVEESNNYPNSITIRRRVEVTRNRHHDSGEEAKYSSPTQKSWSRQSSSATSARMHHLPALPAREVEMSQALQQTTMHERDATRMVAVAAEEYARRGKLELNEDQSKEATKAALWVAEKLQTYRRLDRGCLHMGGPFRAVVFLPNHDQPLAYEAKLKEVMPSTLFTVEKIGTYDDEIGCRTMDTEDWINAVRFAGFEERFKIIVGATLCIPFIALAGVCGCCDHFCVTHDQEHNCCSCGERWLICSSGLQQGQPYLVTVVADAPTHVVME